MSRILLLALAVACCAAKPPDPKKVPALPESMYLAGTRTPDTTAAGGFGPSMHLPMKLRGPAVFKAGDVGGRRGGGADHVLRQ